MTTLNPIDLARFSRRIVAARCAMANACIESSYVFEQAGAELGLRITRVVAQAQAFSPALARMIAEGAPNKEISQRMGQPGYWSIGVGMPSEPGDYMGRMDQARNRYVGHVLCLIEDGQGQSGLIDPSADQMSRPAKGLVINDPVYAYPCTQEELVGKDWIIARNDSGAVIRYQIFPEVAALPPVRQKEWSRVAKGVVKQFSDQYL